jgi:hypothetical protein
MKKKYKTRIPDTNNAGHRREPLTVKRIMNTIKFGLRADIVREVMGHKYEPFLSDYVEHLKNSKYNKFKTPSDQELKAYHDYIKDNSKDSIFKFKEKVGATSRNDALYKIGRISYYENKIKPNQISAS